MSKKCRRLCLGLTLLEALITITVLGILGAIALPAFSSMRETIRLKGATEAVLTSLRLAKSESIKRNRNVSVTFRTSGNVWCFGYSQGAPCDCKLLSSCVVDDVEHRWDHTLHPDITLASNVSGNRFSFQPSRGTVTAGNVQLTAPSGKALRVVVSGLGRIRTCSPRGVGKVVGYPDCG